MQLRQQGDGENAGWRAVFDVLNLNWVGQGTAESNRLYPSLALIIEKATLRLQGLASGGEAEPVF